MSYNTSTQVTLANNFSATANITVTHEYSDEGMYSNRWLNVASAAIADPPWQVSYNTGLLHIGQDYWSIQVEVVAGDQAGVWRTARFECTLHPDNANTILQGTVSPTGVTIHKPSGDCHKPLSS